MVIAVQCPCWESREIDGTKKVVVAPDTLRITSTLKTLRQSIPQEAVVNQLQAGRQATKVFHTIDYQCSKLHSRFMLKRVLNEEHIGTSRAEILGKRSTSRAVMCNSHVLRYKTKSPSLEPLSLIMKKPSGLVISLISTDFRVIFSWNQMGWGPVIPLISHWDN